MNTLRTIMRGGLLVAFAILGVGASTGCATAFTGDAHVPGGPAGCRDRCGSYGMDLAGMVSMGEYSDGCICKVRAQAASGDEGSTLAVAGAAPAAVGVVMAMRQQQQQQQMAH